MKIKAIVFLVFLFVLVQPATATDITFSISEPSNDLSTVFTLVPPSSYYRGSCGGSVSIQEEVKTTPSKTPVPTIISTITPAQIPTTTETSQEEVGTNQTSTEEGDIFTCSLFVTILVVLFLSYVYVISKMAIEMEEHDKT